MSENEIISGFEHQASEAEKALSILQELNKKGTSLQNKIKDKERELEKLQSELNLEEKDLKYEKYLYEQKTSAVERKSLAMDVLESELDKEKKKIEDKMDQVKNSSKVEIEALENKIEKIKSLTRATITDLENKLETVIKKFEIKKKSSEGEIDKTINYYDRQLALINSEKKSTPKIRSIEADIINLYKDLHQVQIQQFGVPKSKCELPFFPRELNEEVEKAQEKYLKENPIVESGHDKARRELMEQRQQREANPEAYWSQYTNQPTLITNTKTKRQPKTVLSY